MLLIVKCEGKYRKLREKMISIKELVLDNFGNYKHQHSKIMSGDKHLKYRHLKGSQL